MKDTPSGMSDRLFLPVPDWWGLIVTSWYTADRHSVRRRLRTVFSVVESINDHAESLHALGAERQETSESVPQHRDQEPRSSSAKHIVAV